MFIPFLYELRALKVPVGTQEAIALAQALELGLHDSSLDGFYDVARSLLVHSEVQLDGLEQAAPQRKKLTPDELKLLEALDAAGLKKLFEQRLREQKERHDGGNKWIGTGGSSPFGNRGAPRDGIRVGGEGGNRRAVKVASERHFKDYRDDLVLDVRQLALALRKLRLFAREGRADELDLDETIEQTARNLGELEVVTRPPRKSNTRVILMMDVGGSMDPYADTVSRLFTAAKKATHFKELRTYYFHNCPYGRVYQSARLRDPISLAQTFISRLKRLVSGSASSSWRATATLPWLSRPAGRYVRSSDCIS